MSIVFFGAVHGGAEITGLIKIMREHCKYKSQLHMNETPIYALKDKRELKSKENVLHQVNKGQRSIERQRECPL